MTMVGIALGGYLFARLGRLPTVLIGAILPVLGNFVYADLAEGAHNIDVVMRASRTGILMSAWISPHRLSVTGVQLRLANNATRTATSTQKSVLRNCIDSNFRARV